MVTVYKYSKCWEVSIYLEQGVVVSGVLQPLTDPPELGLPGDGEERPVEVGVVLAQVLLLLVAPHLSLDGGRGHSYVKSAQRGSKKCLKFADQKYRVTQLLLRLFHFLPDSAWACENLAVGTE